MSNEIELLAKDIFDFTLKYCVYDELMSNYNSEKEIYDEILNSLINKTDINEKVLIGYLEGGWDFNSQEYKDITSLLYRINELKGKQVYVVYISNYGELLTDCPPTDILGIFDTEEKAQKEFNKHIKDNKELGFKLDLNYKDDIENRDFATMFWKEQENWGCYFDISIKKVEVQ